jgi:predicted aconitase with swiveling domain
MSDTITLHAHPISKGIAEGEALVTDRSLCFIAAAITNEEGIVRIEGHPLNGKSVTGKVLIYDTDIYSSGAAMCFLTKWKINKSNPVAIICRQMHNIGAGMTIYCGVPSVDEIEEGLPWDFISDGDWVKVDADNGIVEVTKKS